MQKEMISMHQAVCIIVLFLFGSSSVMGMSPEAGQDSWIAMLLAIVLGSVAVFIYARLIRLFPGMDFYDMCQVVWGKIVGKIIILLMTGYALHLGAIVLRDFSEYIKITALQETPQLFLMLPMLVITGYMTLSGIGTLGKWSMIALPLILIMTLVTMPLFFSEMKLSNILPVMQHDFTSIGSATLRYFTIPFASTVLFLTLADSIKKSDNPYKIYWYALCIGAVVLILIFFRNIMVLGVPMMGKSYFPSYTAARVIDIGDFLSRIEMTISYNFILAGITKIAVCILAAAKGIEKIFNIRNKKTLLLVSALILIISRVMFDSFMEMINFINIYQYYALIFQVVIPVLLWISAEIKMHKKAA